MKTGFLQGYRNKPVKKYYFYHGQIMDCLLQPDAEPYKMYDTKEEEGFTWEEERANWIKANDYEKDEGAGNHWYNEPWGYDYQDGQAATGWIETYYPDYTSWTYYVIYKRGEIAVKKVRVYLWEDDIINLIRVGIRANDEWIEIYVGPDTGGGWTEYLLDTPRIITGVRYKWNLTTRYPFYIPELPESAAVLVKGNEFYGYEIS